MKIATTVSIYDVVNSDSVLFQTLKQYLSLRRYRLRVFIAMEIALIDLVYDIINSVSVLF